MLSAQELCAPPPKKSLISFKNDRQTVNAIEQNEQFWSASAF